MGQKQVIAQFEQDQHYFSLWICQDEIHLDMQLQAQPQKMRLSGQAWLNFEDEARIDDVNRNINVFILMIRCREYLIHYLQKHGLSYFYFHASTSRKAKIYPRFAQNLAMQLSDYEFCQNEESFYFYRKA